jgi:hypothetical protein
MYKPIYKLKTELQTCNWRTTSWITMYNIPAELQAEYQTTSLKLTNYELNCDVQCTSQLHIPVATNVSSKLFMGYVWVLNFK